MSGAQKPLDYDALNVLASHWLEVLGGECGGDPAHAGLTASTLLPKERTYTDFLLPWKPGFVAGVECGMRIAAAIIADGVTDPRGELEHAVDIAKEELDDDIRIMTEEWDKFGYPQPPSKKPTTKRHATA